MSSLSPKNPPEKSALMTNWQPFFCRDPGRLPEPARGKLISEFIRADRIMLILITFYWLVLATLGGQNNGHYLFGYLGGGLAVLIGLIGYHYFKGSYINRILIGCVSCLVEIVYIQQTLGAPTAHLVYFMSLGFLLVYRDGFAAVSSLTLVMTHHLTATYCESVGIEAFGMPILAFNWGRWDAFATHLYWAVLMIVLLCFITYNSMQSFLRSENALEGMAAVNAQLDEQVAQRNALLSQTANEIGAIFANISEAVITIGRDKTIDPQYSACSTQILATSSIAGQPAMTVLFHDTDLSVDRLSQLEATLDACLGSPLSTFTEQRSLMVEHCCKRSKLGNKYLNFSWQPIVNDQQVVERILVSISDSTHIRQLEAITDKENLNLEMIAHLLHTDVDEFFIFVAQAEEQLLGCILLIEGIDKSILTNHRPMSPGDTGLRLQKISYQLNALEQQAAKLGLTYLQSGIRAAANYCATLTDSGRLDAPRLCAELENAQQLLKDYIEVSTTTLSWVQQNDHDGGKLLAINKQQSQNILDILHKMDTSQPAEIDRVLADVRHYLADLIKRNQVKNP